jgi:hypothetical protein
MNIKGEHLFFKKIEIWKLYLAVVLGILLAMSSAIMVRQELVGFYKLGKISKAALFIAELPSNLKRIRRSAIGDFDLRSKEQRFPGVSGFHGNPLNYEAYLLLSRYDGNISEAIVELVDLRSFEVIKKWNPDLNQINKSLDFARPENKNHNEARFNLVHPFLTKDGGLIFQNGSPLIKIDENSQLVWHNNEAEFHHSLEQDHEGNFWIPTAMYPYAVDKKYVGTNLGYADDAITKVSENGEIMFQKSVTNILIENNFENLLYQVDSAPFNHDPIHLNDIQPVQSDTDYWKRGDVFISLRHQSMIILYRPKTNKIIWVGQGFSFAQHDVDILDDHRISIFNNNSKTFFDGPQVDGHNNIVIYDFKSNTYSKYLDESLKNNEIRTFSAGLSQILDNGDLFIEEQNSGRTIYVNKNNSVVWEHVNRAENGLIYSINWSRILYKPEDIKKIHNLL